MVEFNHLLSLSEASNPRHSVRDCTLTLSAHALPTDLAMKSKNTRESYVAREVVAWSRRHSGSSSSSSSNGRLPSSGSSGQQAKPMVGNESRVHRWSGGRWRKGREASGCWGVCGDGKCFSTLLLQWYDQRETQRKEEPQHQRFATVHPCRWSQREGRNWIKCVLYL